MSNQTSTSNAAIEYKNGDVINYDNGVVRGVGRIRGIAQNGEACIGRTFIVEDLSGNIPNEKYSFNHFSLFECYIVKSTVRELNDAFAAIENRNDINTHSYKATLGYCPVCGSPGTLRERRINGNDICANGHSYPSKDALTEPKRN